MTPVYQFHHAVYGRTFADVPCFSAKFGLKNLVASRHLTFELQFYAAREFLMTKRGGWLQLHGRCTENGILRLHVYIDIEE